ncbi:hypothetical protein CapIbe_004592 [Capra ibex]
MGFPSRWSLYHFGKFGHKHNRPLVNKWLDWRKQKYSRPVGCRHSGCISANLLLIAGRQAVSYGPRDRWGDQIEAWGRVD